MKYSLFKIQNLRFNTPHSALRTPHFALRTPCTRGSTRKRWGQAPHSSRGFAYIALLAAIVIIGISLGTAGKYWQNVILRDKEEDLLFRGDQYRKAIERFYFALPGRPHYPESIDHLLTDNRTATGKRHLRRKYKDPMTGEDFVEIRDPLSKRIIGVHSSSDKKPLKRDNFAENDTDFAGKDKYSEWKFVFTARPGQPAIPGHPPAPTPRP